MLRPSLQAPRRSFASAPPPTKATPPVKAPAAVPQRVRAHQPSHVMALQLQEKSSFQDPGLNKFYQKCQEKIGYRPCPGARCSCNLAAASSRMSYAPTRTTRSA